MDMSLLDKIGVKWNRYMRWTPTAKQLAFLMYRGSEMLYGGSAGGGKSASLILSALQYCDVPGYSAIVFRKSLTELKGADGIIPKAESLLAPFIASKEVKYVASEHAYYFKTVDWDGKPGEPARLEFGYIGTGNAKIKYQGRAYSFIGWDELTHHTRSDYEYLFSRRRQNVCPIHQLIDGKPNYIDGCPMCEIRRQVPLRTRAATNPGGPGANWVKQWFKIEPDRDPEIAALKGQKVNWIGRNPSAPFLPASLSDNPYIDQQSYRYSFTKLDDETRAQLEDGSWAEGGSTKFKRQWFRRYSTNGNHYILGRDRVNEHGAFTFGQMQKIWITCDSAASTDEGQLDEVLNPKSDPNYTVFMVTALTPSWHLLVIDMLRFKDEVPIVVDKMVEYWKKWKDVCEYALVENKGTGLAVVQEATRRGVRVKAARATKDKVVRATPAMMRAKSNRIWLPQEMTPWLKDFEDEVFGWQGYPTEQDDIVDTLAHAVNDVDWPENLETIQQDESNILQAQSTEPPSLMFVDFQSIDISDLWG